MKKCGGRSGKVWREVSGECGGCEEVLGGVWRSVGEVWKSVGEV